MRARDSQPKRPSAPTHLSRTYEDREIVIPHAADARPLVAVRNVLIQASLTELKAHEQYERYSTHIGPKLRMELEAAALAPGWVSVDLAHAHYAACDRLRLTRAQYEALGVGVGDRVQSAVLIALAKKVREADYDLWLAVGPLHRMWPRVFQGGSVQVSKLGPKDQLLEERGFSLNRYEYYRYAHIAALRATYEAVGSNSTVSLVGYDPSSDEMSVRVTWT